MRSEKEKGKDLDKEGASKTRLFKSLYTAGGLRHEEQEAGIVEDITLTWKSDLAAKKEWGEGEHG